METSTSATGLATLREATGNGLGEVAGRHDIRVRDNYRPGPTRGSVHTPRCFDPQPGDVVFGRRPSWVQHLLGLAGDFLSHCGVVVDIGGERRVAEFGPQGAFSRPLDEFFSAYELNGYLRLNAHATCREAVATSARERLARNEWTYCWSAGVLLDAGLVVRRYLPSSLDPRLSELVLGLARKLHQRGGDRSITCAGFVLDCVGDTCADCRSVIGWPSRDRVPGWRTSPSITDAWRRRLVGEVPDGALVRLLVSPFDLWVSLSAEFRVVVDEGVTTVIVDHLDSPPPATPVALAA